MGACLIDAGGLWIDIKKNFYIFFYNLLVCARRTTTLKPGRGKQDTCKWWIGQVVIKTNRSDKTGIKKFFLKISGPQQRWPRPLPGAILIPPALLVVADSPKSLSIVITIRFSKAAKRIISWSGILWSNERTAFVSYLFFKQIRFHFFPNANVNQEF